MSSVREKRAAERVVPNLPVCPRCFTYATGDEARCLDCGYGLYQRLKEKK